MNGNEIALIAKKYIGQVERNGSGNVGFKDLEFERRMKLVGWETGQAWCVYQAELIWDEAYSKNKEIRAIIKKLFSGSATATYKNFDLHGLFTCSQVPVVGAIAIYRFGADWRGHAGVVIAADTRANITTNVEGNTNSKGGREGLETAEKKRLIDEPFKKKGLNLVGFIHPVEASEK